ncbi:MAG: transglutaminase-like domain-containing protein, partial [Candidatus Poseidoniales archaeon]|nr:transglutaminase-like domain-containing protein [Candidatus Poseidoniales archaeon]
GWFSLHTQYDSDGDGVNDLDEVLNGTDPMEPCHNNLDSDGDMLNDYFENNTGCDLMYVPGMGGGNGSTDTYVTDPFDPDTDNGGVMDGQEYLDGTNPEWDPLDDMNPADTDGDGIPDNIENQTGTDWRDPDTDGGGMSDYEECPPQYWQDCHLSPQDPWDPTDDIIQNEIAFWANNTTSTGNGVYPDLSHYWRVRTYEYYTGAAYGMNESSLIETEISPGWIDYHWIANDTFWDSSEDYWMTYVQPVNPGSRLPQPASAYSWMMWGDPFAYLNQSNVSHDLRISAAQIYDLMTSQPEISFTSTEYANSIPYAGPGNYGTDLPGYFTDMTAPESYVYDVTQGVIADAGAVSAWDKVVAIRDYLNNADGNTSVEFKLNFDGSGLPMLEDVSRFILQDLMEGSCQEFSTVFTTMARLAGIPARKATGYSGGVWTGTGFMVMGRNWDAWGEVHLQQNAAGNNLDMGWIPVDACPPAEQVEVVNETSWPGSIERDMSTGDIYMNGTLQFTANQSAAADTLVRAYLVQANDTNPFNPAALNAESLLSANLTDSNGNFSIKGFPFGITHPGYGRIVVETQQGGYVPYSTHDFVWTVNITDNTSLSQDSPVPVGVPYVGAGSTTDITGTMMWNSPPLLDVSTKTNYTVSLTYNSSVLNANVTLTTQVGANGYFMFTVNLSENENLGMRNASLEFAGWHEADLHLDPSPVYHARPTTYNFLFNVTPAPDLTATLHGPSTNNSLLEIGENIYINGTIHSGGASPAPMDGTLILLLRRNGSTGPYTETAFWVLNSTNVNQVTGDFSIVWNFSAFDVTIGPAYCDVILRFLPDVPGATDDADLTPVFAYGIQSTVEINFPINVMLRGQLTFIPVSYVDHTAGNDIPFDGTWVIRFNGAVINTTIDPSNPWMEIEFTPAA